MCMLVRKSKACSSSHHLQNLEHYKYLQRNPRTPRKTAISLLQTFRTTSFITTNTMTGTSSVGPISVNGAGDQRNVKNSELEHAERYEEGKVNSHNTDDPSKTHFPA